MMLFPGNRIDRKITINRARGFHPRYKDRFDLTLECIRRYYIGEYSPISATIERSGDFFNLLEGFYGYVEFFLLQDMVDENFTCVKFFMPNDGFTTLSLPASMEGYRSYMQRGWFH